MSKPTAEDLDRACDTALARARNGHGDMRELARTLIYYAAALEYHDDRHPRHRRPSVENPSVRPDRWADADE